MTESVVALPHGTPSGGVHSPRASARAHARASVTHREQVRVSKHTNTATRLRHFGRVMYLDAADSWIVSDSTPSIKTVWNTDYSTTVPGNYRPFIIWCRVWRYPAVACAATLDSAKWLLIHPLRGPLFIATIGGTVAATYLT